MRSRQDANGRSNRWRKLPALRCLTGAFRKTGGQLVHLRLSLGLLTLGLLDLAPSCVLVSHAASVAQNGVKCQTPKNQTQALPSDQLMKRLLSIASASQPDGQGRETCACPRPSLTSLRSCHARRETAAQATSAALKGSPGVPLPCPRTLASTARHSSLTP